MIAPCCTTPRRAPERSTAERNSSCSDGPIAQKFSCSPVSAQKRDRLIDGLRRSRTSGRRSRGRTHRGTASATRMLPGAHVPVAETVIPSARTQSSSRSTAARAERERVRELVERLHRITRPREPLVLGHRLDAHREEAGVAKPSVHVDVTRLHRMGLVDRGDPVRVVGGDPGERRRAPRAPRPEPAASAGCRGRTGRCCSSSSRRLGGDPSASRPRPSRSTRRRRDRVCARRCRPRRGRAELNAHTFGIVGDHAWMSTGCRSVARSRAWRSGRSPSARSW